MENIEIKMSKGKTMISLVALGIMGLIGILLTYLSYTSNWTFLFGHHSIWMGVFIFMTVFSWGAVVWMYKKSNNPEPILIIKSDGIMDNAAFLKGRLIKWSEIKNIETKTVFGSKQFAIYLHEPEEFLNGFSGMKKTFLSSTYKQQGTPVLLVVQSYDFDKDELFRILTERIKS
jgi:hypothetical protein